MKTGLKNIKSGERLVYFILWLSIFLMPVFLSNEVAGINWSRVKAEWIKISPFFAVFIIHNTIVFPQLFSQKNKLWYFAATILLATLIGLLWVFISKNIHQNWVPHANFPYSKGFPAGSISKLRPQPILQLLTETVLIAVLVAGCNAAIKIAVKFQHEEQKNKELEKEKLQTELAFLRNQIGPHFLMNTLNNIHALIDVNSEIAKESLIKLSRLMRYLLYGSEQGNTSLQKEIDFIRNYVDLMKLRFSDKVKIELSFPEKVPEVNVPPLLFTSLVENAFKHGVSYQTQSFIGIYLSVHQQKLFFRIKNSIHKNSEHPEKGGLGLKNLNKRLELLYHSNFDLKTSIDDSFFEINVKIPLYEN